MKKNQQKLTPAQEENARLQKLLDTRLKAYQSGASADIMLQIENMIAEAQLNLYTESELERHRKNPDDDGEQWIV